MSASHPSPTTLILGAGRSSRMGRDKLLLPIGGQLAVARLLETALRVCDTAVLVLGANHDSVTAALQRQPWLSRVRIAVNPNPERGMFSSVQAGLAAVPADTPVFVQPADQPLVPASVYEALLPALGDHDAVIPTCEGRGGHPALLAAHTVQTLLLAPADSNLRDELRKLDVLRLPVDEKAILHNWNTPRDIELPSDSK